MFVWVKMLRLLLLICFIIPLCLAHNIDIKVSPIIKEGSAASYFGFSLTGVVADGMKSWVAVGSPKANTSRLNKPAGRNYNLNETGALYKCPMTMDRKCEDISSVIVYSELNKVGKYDFSNGWYGVSVASGGKAEDKLLVCSHRTRVAYCFRSTCRFGLPGGCREVLKKTSRGRNSFFKIDTANNADLAGGGNKGVDYSRSQFGQMGISATLPVPKRYLTGAVGIKLWTGAAIIGNTKVDVGQKEFSYAGYSVASGTFINGEIGFVVGAPRNNLMGAVFVYTSLTKLDVTYTIRGDQVGAYFGMSVCACDFNNDTISEIVVGAPYYTDPSKFNKPEVGRVFVYGKEDNFTQPIRTLKAQEAQARALFGRCVASLGDVNRDGFQDLGVGAPYQDGGGAVYIYHGSRIGLATTPVQIIKASMLPYPLKAFGSSFRGEYDLDGNGYPDIVVGAYGSDSIMILRSVPVVEVTAKYELSPSFVDVSNRNCSVNVLVQGKSQTIETVCFHVEIFASYEDRAGIMKNNINVSFQLEADTLVEDTKNRRVRFEITHDYKVEIKNRQVESGVKKRIVRLKAYLRTDLCPTCDNKILEFPDIQLVLTKSLPDRPKDFNIPTSGEPPSLDDYFQLPYYTYYQEFDNVTTTMLNVKRACEPCEPNLMIKNIGTTKIAVKSVHMYIKVEVGNSGKDAFTVQLKAVFPHPLIPTSCGTVDDVDKCLYGECSSKKVENNSTELTCLLGNFKNKAKKYAIRVETIQASNPGDLNYREFYEVPINVRSANPEEVALLGDNSLSLKLTVASEADIGIRRLESSPNMRYGGTVRGQYSMTSLEQIGLPVEQKYLVENNGPDQVPEVNITIEWPYQAKSGKHLLYLISVKGERKNIKCFPKPGLVNSLASQFKNATLTKEVLDEGLTQRVRRDVGDDKEDVKASPAVKQPESKGFGSKVVLDCRNNTAMCIQIPCTITNFEAGDKVGVTIQSRIWNGTLLEDYTGQVVQVFSHARIDELTGYVNDTNTDNHEAEISTSFYPEQPKTKKKGVEVWIIVVSAIAGVVLLVILIVIFKMCGFFNRMETERYDAVPEN